MRITVNQLMLVLATYRGTLENELSVGTRSQDMKVLGQAGLVQRAMPARNGSTHRLTVKGAALVNALLDVAQGVAEDHTVGLVVADESGTLPVHVNCRSALVPVVDGNPLDRLGTMPYGAFVPEDNVPGIALSDVEGDKGRIAGGTFFIVAEAGVELQPKAEGSEADFSGIKLAKVDMTVHGTESKATEVAAERAKSDVGSRHLVLKAVAMHEVAVPIRSVRL